MRSRNDKAENGRFSRTRAAMVGLVGAGFGTLVVATINYVRYGSEEPANQNAPVVVVVSLGIILAGAVGWLVVGVLQRRVVER